MAKFYFKCPFCDKEIKAYPEMIGQVGQCPFCDYDIIIKDPRRLEETKTVPKPPEAIKSETPKQDKIKQAQSKTCLNKNQQNNFFQTVGFLLLFLAAIVCPFFVLFSQTNFWRVVFLLPFWGLLAVVYCKNVKAAYHGKGEFSFFSLSFSILALGVLVTSIFWGISLVANPVTSYDRKEDFSSYQEIARSYIKSRLHNPKGANFGWGLWGTAKKTNVPSVGECIMVSGTVDGTNLFGGKVTQYFEVTIDKESKSVIHFYAK